MPPALPPPTTDALHLALHDHTPSRAGRGLPAGDDRHRISLHLSRATRTACRQGAWRGLRQRGDIDIAPAHSGEGFDADTDYRSLELTIAPQYLEALADDLGLPARQARLPTAHLLRDARLQGLLSALAADLQCDTPHGDLFREGLAASVAAALLLRNGTPPAPRAEAAAASTALPRVLEHIEARLEHPLTLQHLAALAGMSPWSLQRLFRRELGMPVHQYVVSRRVERARLLLQRRAAPLGEIALMAGFSHQGHMARWLRRVLGTTPAALAQSASR